jgi:hypothetical protein
VRAGRGEWCCRVLRLHACRPLGCWPGMALVHCCVAASQPPLHAHIPCLPFLPFLSCPPLPCHSAIFRDFDPAFEAGSLDEAYLDVTHYCAAQGVTPEQAAAQIRGRVQQETRLTCSGGGGALGEGSGV